MSSSDWLPAHAPFDMVRRGYSPEQVNTHLERLEYEMRIAVADRDANSQRLAEMTTQLAASQGEADSMRAELNRMAREPMSMAGLSERMQRMIRLAEEEAADIRRRADTEAEEMRAKLTAAQDEHAAARAAFDTERERTRKQLAEQVHDLVAEATAEAESTREQARADAAAMLAAATAERDSTLAQAEQESSRTLAEAREESTRTLTDAREESSRTLAEAREEAANTLTAARSEAEDRVGRARVEADRLTSQSQEAARSTTAAATAECQRLEAESLAHRTQAEEDFEIALNARRTKEADEAQSRHEQSVAEAERRVNEATAQAADLVSRAADEAHRRVVEADAAVHSLTELRQQLLAQIAGLSDHLDHIRDLTTAAPPLLTPPPSESSRPLPEHFPPGPATPRDDAGGNDRPAAPDGAADPERSGPRAEQNPETTQVLTPEQRTSAPTHGERVGQRR